MAKDFRHDVFDGYDDMTVEDVEAAVDDIEDPDVLRAFREHEASNKGRKTAVEAIDQRLEAVEADSESDDADDDDDDQPDDPNDDTLSALAEAADGWSGPEAADAVNEDDTEYVRVRNGTREEIRPLHIGPLAPGQVKVVQKTATVEQHIRNGRIQVLNSDARDTASVGSAPGEAE